MTNKFLFFLLLLFPALDSYGTSLTFKRYGTQGYMVNGFVDSHMLQPVKSGIPGGFYLFVHETGKIYYSFKNTNNYEYCPDNAKGAAGFINNRLRRGMWASQKNQMFDNGRPWTAEVGCASGPNKSWRIATTLPTPPNSASCTITYPFAVSFGNVTLGAQKNVNAAVNISCDKLADITVSFSKEAVRLGDASVNYYFPGNKKNYLMRVNENIPASFNIRFSLESTGNTLGYKFGDAVMLFEWL